MFSYPENLTEFCDALRREERCEIDESMFDYFLDVLPPVFMSRVVKLCEGTSVWAEFGFVEGADVVVAFFRQNGKTFAQHTTMHRLW